MKNRVIARSVVCASCVLGANTLNAAEIDISGFASFVGGKTLNTNTLPNGDEPEVLIDPVDSTQNGERNDKAYYSEDLSFSPDTSYGLQIRADLSEGLTVTTLLSGKGTDNFQAEIDWAYLTYEINNNVKFHAGRKRLPFYYYSDFIDVGYAYHWVRPPVDIYTLPIKSYEGLGLSLAHVVGSWELSSQFLVGSGSEKNSLIGDLTMNSIVGAEVKAANSWLEVRSAYSVAEIFTRGTTTNEDNPINVTFFSASAHMEFSAFFLTAEFSEIATDEYIEVNPLSSIDSTPGYFVSMGYQLGDFTPHITFADTKTKQTGDLNPFLADLDAGTQTTTVGLRWDFHPSADFKFEYSSQKDTSDKQIIDLAGRANELDFISFGFDVIF